MQLGALSGETFFGSWFSSRMTRARSSAIHTRVSSTYACAMSCRLSLSCTACSTAIARRRATDLAALGATA
jgi:hypothetical protein